MANTPDPAHLPDRDTRRWCGSTRHHARSLLLAAVWLSLIGASAGAHAQSAAGRPDAEERQRLRHELRDQLRDARSRAGGREAAGDPGPVQADGWSGAPNRLSPEERQLLRRQVREARHRGD